MAVEKGEAEIDRELFGGRGTGHHQFGGPRVGPLYLGCAQATQSEERHPQLHLQLRLHAGALVSFRELARQRDRAGEVLD